jgi:pimeloyl-ACP methyl ester carboxylesterase
MSRSTDRAATPPWLDRAAYPFRSRWCELPGGHRLHYVDEGAGEPVLFVHGTPSWSFEWRHLIRALSATHRCVAPDHLGFGLSDRPRDAAYTPEAHAERLAAFVARLGLDGVTLVVHDYGGPIGLPLALADRPRVRRLVVLNSWMWSFAGDRDMERAARVAGGAIGRFLYRHANLSLKVIMPSAYGDRRKLTPEIHRQYLAPFPDAWSRGAVLWPLASALLGSGAHYDALWRERHRLRALPALVVWGTADSAFRPHNLARWREALPHATVVELPVGHWPQEEAPDAVADAVRSFLGTTAAA